MCWLADHNAIHSHVPHHGGLVPTGFELVVDIFPFVGTLDGSAVLIDQRPLFRIARRLREESGIITRFGVKGTAILGVRTAASRRHLHLRR